MEGRMPFDTRDDTPTFFAYDYVSFGSVAREINPLPHSRLE